MMMTLGLDTTGPAASVALWQGPTDGGAVLGSISQTMARGHAEAVMPLVRTLVGDVIGTGADGFSQINRIAAMSGPGSFTGVRIAIAAARGLALAIGCPVVAVTAFEAVARLHTENQTRFAPFAIAFDARRGQVYLQCFNSDGSGLSEPGAVDLGVVAEVVPDGVECVLGSGAGLIAEILRAGGRRIVVEAAPDRNAVIVARLGADREAGVPPLPLYLRRPDAKPQKAPLARVAL